MNSNHVGGDATGKNYNDSRSDNSHTDTTQNLTIDLEADKQTFELLETSNDNLKM